MAYTFGYFFKIRNQNFGFQDGLDWNLFSAGTSDKIIINIQFEYVRVFHFVAVAHLGFWTLILWLEISNGESVHIVYSN